MLNPIFATPGFAPDPQVSYFCTTEVKDIGFTYLHALVLGGPTRLGELQEFSTTQPQEFKRLALTQTKGGWTPLMLAARNSARDSSNEAVKLLLPVSDPTQQTVYAWTPPVMAARYSRAESTEETVRLLIAAGYFERNSRKCWYALMGAAMSVQDESTEGTVQMLLPITDLTMKSKDGLTVCDILAYNKPTLLQHPDFQPHLSTINPKILDVLCQEQMIDHLSIIYGLLPAERFETVCQRYPRIFLQLLTLAQQRLNDRQNYQSAISAGLSDTEALIQSYL